jgi:hypothetical protein
VSRDLHDAGDCWSTSCQYCAWEDEQETAQAHDGEHDEQGESE